MSNFDEFKALYSLSGQLVEELDNEQVAEVAGLLALACRGLPGAVQRYPSKRVPRSIRCFARRSLGPKRCHLSRSML